MAEIITPQKATKVTFSLAPAYNTIGSLALLGMAEGFSGLDEWVYNTVKVLTPEQLRVNQLALHDSHVDLDDAAWVSTPAWLDHLESQDATALRDRALQVWLERVKKFVGGDLPSPSELLSDRAAYLALVERFHQARGKPYEVDTWESLHELLTDPQGRKDLFLTHFRTMWQMHLEQEWQAKLPLLEESLKAFESLDFTGVTAAGALERVALRAQIPQESMGYLSSLEQITLIPSPHTGPYLIHLDSLDPTSARFLFGARIPAGAISHLPALNRSELLMRLNALSNDTRLLILELIGKQGELGTPEVMAQLELSQSAAARHLEHLTATGFLITRRRQGTNVFQLNPERIDLTFKALKDFIQ
jgi:DNA-binding transcriptional ArsR family regulator